MESCHRVKMRKREKVKMRKCEKKKQKIPKKKSSRRVQPLAAILFGDDDEAQKTPS